MKNLYFAPVLLCAITLMVHADKCQYPASEDFVYHLRPYVEEGNVTGIAQLTAQLSALKQSKSTFNLDRCTQNYVDRVYKNIVINSDEESLKLIAPFMVEYGYKFLKAPVHATSTRYLMRGRWEVDVVSQVPGIMTADIKKYKIYEITTAWPLIPYAAQQRIKKELNTYYDDNCSIYSEDCNQLNSKLSALIDSEYVFKKICKIMPQELKDQADAKKAAMKERLAAYEAAADRAANTAVSTPDVPANSEQSSTPIESAATSTSE